MVSAKRQIKTPETTAAEEPAEPLSLVEPAPRPAVPVKKTGAATKRPTVNASAQRTLLGVLGGARYIEAALLEVFEPAGQKWGIGGEQGVGLTMVKFNALMSLYSAPDHTLPQNRLKELFAVTRANITRIVKDLERDDLIMRTMDEQDNRFKYVHLTPRAIEFMGDLLPQHYANVERLASALTPDEQQTLSALLRKLREGPKL